MSKREIKRKHDDVADDVGLAKKSREDSTSQKPVAVVAPLSVAPSQLAVATNATDEFDAIAMQYDARRALDTIFPPATRDAKMQENVDGLLQRADLRDIIEKLIAVSLLMERGRNNAMTSIAQIGDLLVAALEHTIPPGKFGEIQAVWNDSRHLLTPPPDYSRQYCIKAQTMTADEIEQLMAESSAAPKIFPIGIVTLRIIMTIAKSMLPTSIDSSDDEN